MLIFYDSNDISCPFIMDIIFIYLAYKAKGSIELIGNNTTIEKF